MTPAAMIRFLTAVTAIAGLPSSGAIADELPPSAGCTLDARAAKTLGRFLCRWFSPLLWLALIGRRFLVPGRSTHRLVASGSHADEQGPWKMTKRKTPKTKIEPVDSDPHEEIERHAALIVEDLIPSMASRLDLCLPCLALEIAKQLNWQIETLQAHHEADGRIGETEGSA